MQQSRNALIDWARDAGLVDLAGALAADGAPPSKDGEPQAPARHPRSFAGLGPELLEALALGAAGLYLTQTMGQRSLEQMARQWLKRLRPRPSPACLWQGLAFTNRSSACLWCRATASGPSWWRPRFSKTPSKCWPSSSWCCAPHAAPPAVARSAVGGAHQRHRSHRSADGSAASPGARHQPAGAQRG